MITLLESYETQKQVEELVDELIEVISENIADEFNNNGKLNDWDVPSISYKDVNPYKYSLIIKLLGSYKSGKVIIVPPFKKNKDDKYKGSYKNVEMSGSFNDNNGNVTIYLDFNYINTKFKNKKLLPGQMELLFNDDSIRRGASIRSTLIHEIQHAFDFKRSDGKLFKGYDEMSKRKKKEEQEQKIKIENDEWISPKWNKHSAFAYYIKLPSEISARFTQAISRCLYVDGGQIVPIRDFIEDFKKKFNYYDKMSPKNKKILIRKASGYWHKFKEENKDLKLHEAFDLNRFDKKLSGVFITIRDPEEYHELIEDLTKWGYERDEFNYVEEYAIEDQDVYPLGIELRPKQSNRYGIYDADNFMDEDYDDYNYYNCDDFYLNNKALNYIRYRGNDKPSYKPKNFKTVESLNEGFYSNNEHLKYETSVKNLPLFMVGDKVKFKKNVLEILSNSFHGNDEEKSEYVKNNLSRILTVYRKFKNYPNEPDNNDAGIYWWTAFETVDSNLDNEIWFPDICLEKAIYKPNYLPRKKLLESVDNDIYEIVVRVENYDDVKILKSIIGEDMRDYEIIMFPNWYFIKFKGEDRKTLIWSARNNNESEMKEVLADSDEVYKNIFTMKDINKIIKIYETGKIIDKPDYSPRKRVLEAFNNKFDFLISLNNKEEYYKIKNDLVKWRYKKDSIIFINEDWMDSSDIYPLTLLIDIKKNNYIVYGFNINELDQSEILDTNNYYSVTEFYEDINAVNFVKYKGVIIPNYKPKSRLLEGVEQWPYRFKTEKEFKEEYGTNWRNRVIFNSSGEMDYLLGTVLEQDFPDDLDYMDLKNDGWVISKKMLTDNVKPRPNYSPKKKRVLESLNFDQYLIKLVHNYGNNKRAQEALDDYKETLKTLQKEGGTLYRVVFLKNIEDLKKDKLGEHWTIYKDDISRFFENIRVEDDDLFPYLITGKFAPKSIAIEKSWETFVEIPDEMEVSIKKQPINYTIEPYFNNNEENINHYNE